MKTFLHRLAPSLNPLQSRVRIYVSGEDPETASSGHGDFDNDTATMNTLLSACLGETPERPFRPTDLDY
jgi:hypothetical protein